MVDCGPAFSPDGHNLAFVRGVALHLSDLYLLPLAPTWAAAGAPKRLTAGNRYSTSPAWTRDGSSIIFAAGVYADLRPFRIAVHGNGEARRLELASNHTPCLAISRQGTLVYAQAVQNDHIWRATLSGPGVIDGAAKQFLASSRTEVNPQFSADGKRVVFASNRGGPSAIWIANADGTSPELLTSMQGSTTGGPNWSPDGSHIVFDSNKEGQWEVYSISAAGGAPRRLTNNPATDGVPSWSRDGAWIYFMSNRSGEPQVWKMPGGGGQPFQVTKQGGYVAVESPDARFVYYSKSSTGEAGLWKVPVDGGEETNVLPSVTLLNFAIANDGIYFIPRAEAPERYAIHFFAFASGKSRPIASLGGRLSYGLAVSPDGKILLYSRGEPIGSDLMLVDGVR